MARIIGTNFRQQSAPPASGPVPERPPSVRVTVGGVECPRVHVLSTTELRVCLPKHAAGACDVVIENIDDDGVLVGSESVTAAAAITYRRPDLSSKGEESTLSRIVRGVRQLLAEQVIANVAITTSTDYADDVFAAVGVVEAATLPAILLTNIKALEDRFYSVNTLARREDSPGIFTTAPPTFTTSPTMTILLLSNSEAELIALMSLATTTIDLNSELEILADAENPEAGVVRFELDFEGQGGFTTNNVPNESNLRQATANIVIRGVVLEPIAEVLAGVAGRTRAGTSQAAPVQDATINPGGIDPAEQGRDPAPDIEAPIVQYAPT